MKYLFLLLLFIGCQKAQPQCPSCFLVIGNSTENQYIVTILGKTYSFAPGEVKQVEIPSGEDVRVYGKPITDKAHNNFNKLYQCGGDCGAVAVILEN